MNDFEILRLSSSSDYYHEGKRYAMLFRHSSNDEFTLKLFDSEKSLRLWLQEGRKNLGAAYSKRQARAHDRFRRYSIGREVECGKCGHKWWTTQTPNRWGYISCGCGAKVKIE